LLTPPLNTPTLPPSESPKPVFTLPELNRPVLHQIHPHG
jgi:hypothetical protein